MKEIKGISWRTEPHALRRKDTQTDKTTLWNRRWRTVFLLASLLRSHVSAVAHIWKITRTPTNTSRCSRIFMMCFQFGLDLSLIYFWLSSINFCWSPWDGWCARSTISDHLRSLSNCRKALKLSLTNKFMHGPWNARQRRSWPTPEPEF
jgi:hypothetical protein